MKSYKRVFTIIIDSLGVGAMPNAQEYGDEGADTLGNIDKAMVHFHIPNLAKLGLANLHPLMHVQPVQEPIGYYTKMLEASVGKDTMTGHWELMGLHISTPFLTFTDHGFPDDLIQELEKRCGRKVIGNKAASGTAILDELAQQELDNGDMIVYTSADSVLQICGHEKSMGLDNLYHYCEIARELTMKPEWMVGRVIARPYSGEKKGEFKRTSNRHDYALKPYGKTALDTLKDHGYDVISVGKIKDIFDGEGITEAYASKSSVHGMEQTIDLLNKDFHGLCFVNLVDFDALWGHRRDPIGYGEELQRFDKLLGTFLEKMKEDDLLLISADHGNDPMFHGSDHTKEMVPLLAYSPRMKGHGLLPLSNTFGTVGATIVDNFGLVMPEHTIGSSILKDIK